MKKSKKDKKDNPYLSAAEVEERKEFERRNRNIKIIIALAVVLVPLGIWLLFKYGTRP